MTLTATDYAVIAAFFAINLGIGVFYARRGGRNVAEFFLSGRNVPWWLAGISMVATTFAVDTPLAVTGFVVQHGIAGNWVWWSAVFSGILTVFFFAKLWRRSGVLTDVEFIELRYSGRPAATLRFVRAVFQGVLVNTIIMGWVNLAMAKVLELTLHVPKIEALAVCLAFTALYVTLGGLWGVLVTDLLQFVVKMSMAIVLAISAVAAAGGMPVLIAKLHGLDLARAHATAGPARGSVLDFFPTTDAAWLPLMTFLTYIAVQWWASSYPGAEPGGGGYIAQRIFSAKSENDSLFATLLFNVAHYALRPWPWILVALAALVLYPHGVTNAAHVVDPELGYVQAMVDYLPAWLRGLMLSGFLAAYMSTMGTHLNLGAAYLTNDLYRRFFVPDAGERHYVVASRVATVVVMGLALVGGLAMTSVGDAYKYLFNLTAGVGLVMILRWYWWRGERLERDRRPRHFRRRVERSADRARDPGRRPEPAGEDPARHRAGDDPRLDPRDVRDEAGTGSDARALLRPRPAERARLGPDRASRLARATAGRPRRQSRRLDRRLRARLLFAFRHWQDRVR